MYLLVGQVNNPQCQEIKHSPLSKSFVVLIPHHCVSRPSACSALHSEYAKAFGHTDGSAQHLPMLPLPNVYVIPPHSLSFTNLCLQAHPQHNELFPHLCFPWLCELNIYYNTYQIIISCFYINLINL